MLSLDVQLEKKSRMERHARREVRKVLEARFIPTAIWTATSETTASPTPASAVVDTTPTEVKQNPKPTKPTPTSTTPTSTSATSTTPILTSTSTSISSTSTLATITITTSTSSTSTSTSTTSTTPTTTSTLVTSTSSTGKAVVTTSSGPTSTTSTPATAFVTTTLSRSNTTVSTASAASATSSSTSTSGVGTAGIIGIAAAGIVGAAIVAGIIMFFIKRRTNRRDDEFDPDDFRRQSVVLQDDAPASRFGPRPPTMIERRNMAGYPVQPAGAYQLGHPSGAPNTFSDFASPQPSPSFTPGQYISSRSQGEQYATVAPFFNPSSQSPMGSPVTMASYGGAAYDTQGRLVRAPSNAAPSMLSRGNSIGYPQHPGSPPLPEDADYADLNRASVTPFQAAQYAAISKQLNIPPPMPLHQVAEGNEHEEYNRANRQSLPVSAVETKPSMDISPFDDSRVDVAQSNENGAGDSEAFKPSRPSSEFHAANSFEPPYELPARVASIPPTLPEIQMSQRTFSPVEYNFPVTPSPHSSSFDAPNAREAPRAVQEPSPLGRASPKIDMPPLSPVLSTPQRAQVVSGVEMHAHNGRETPVEIAFVAESSPHQAEVSYTPAAGATQSNSQALEKKRPETVYDDDDAYGGF